MIVTSCDTIEDRQIADVLGLVTGAMVHSKHVGRDIAAGCKSIIGGELVGYTEMLAESREEAVVRMIAEANELGADAVVAVRYNTSAIMQGSAEMLAYGTAVKLEGN